jgi:hypothetical protein
MNIKREMLRIRLNLAALRKSTDYLELYEMVGEEETMD